MLVAQPARPAAPSSSSAGLGRARARVCLWCPYANARDTRRCQAWLYVNHSDIRPDPSQQQQQRRPRARISGSGAADNELEGLELSTGAPSTTSRLGGEGGILSGRIRHFRLDLKPLRLDRPAGGQGECSGRSETGPTGWRACGQASWPPASRPSLLAAGMVAQQGWQWK